MKRSLVIPLLFVAFLAGAAAGHYVKWPPDRYYMTTVTGYGGQVVPARVDRQTGTLEISSGEGWHR